jgi:hypothetical protein
MRLGEQLSREIANIQNSLREPTLADSLSTPAPVSDELPPRARAKRLSAVPPKGVEPGNSVLEESRIKEKFISRSVTPSEKLNA